MTAVGAVKSMIDNISRNLIAPVEMVAERAA